MQSIFYELFKQYVLFMDIYIYSLIERCKSLCILEFLTIFQATCCPPANKVTFEPSPNSWSMQNLNYLGTQKYLNSKYENSKLFIVVASCSIIAIWYFFENNVKSNCLLERQQCTRERDKQSVIVFFYVFKLFCISIKNREGIDWQWPG